MRNLARLNAEKAGPDAQSRLRTPIRRLYCRIEEEFDVLDAQTLTEGNRCRLVKDPGLAELNRYCDVLPFRENLVLLDGADAPCPANYINANFVGHPFRAAERRFIACQAPLPHTVHAFCRMLLREGVGEVVTIINEQEDPQRYFDYWTESSTYGAHRVRVLEQVAASGFLRVARLEVSCCDSGERRELTHFHIAEWRDYCAPSAQNLSAFVEFLRRLLAGKERSSPVVVHCSAGIGRTMTFICSYFLVEQTAPGCDGEARLRHSVRDLVSGLREQRYHAVNTLKQYKFLYEVAHFLQEEGDEEPLRPCF